MSDHISTPPDEWELQAYADGRLPADTARGREIKCWLDDHDFQRAQVLAYRLQDETIRRHYAAALAEPIPATLQISNIRLRQSSRRQQWPLLAAASVAAFVVSVGAWSLQAHFSNPAERDLEQFAQTVAGHVRGSDEVATGSTTNNVQSAAKSAAMLPLPGFTPATTHRVQIEGDVISQTLYQDDQGQRLSLFVRDLDRGPPATMRWRHDDRVLMAYWQQDGRLYALAGDLSQETLGEIAARAASEAANQQYAGAHRPLHAHVFASPAPADLPPDVPKLEPLMAGSEPIQALVDPGVTQVDAVTPELIGDGLGEETGL